VSGFLRHNAHDAHHYGVEVDQSGHPLEASLNALADAPDTKVLSITTENGTCGTSTPQAPSP